MSDIYLSNNAGGRSSPTPESSQPKITQTAVRLTDAVAGTNASTTVTPGSRYRFTSLIAGGFIFGLATVATAGNVRWVCPLYHSIEIEIPVGYVLLHHTTDTTGATNVGYLVELK